MTAKTNTSRWRAITLQRRETLFLWLIAFASTAAWIPLYRWYGLFENRDNTHFAFEKIPGYFDSPIIRRTLALFILIGLLYAIAIWLVHRLPALALADKLGIVTLVTGPALINIALYPVGALDVFNYMIELKLTWFYDQNPYLVTFEAYRSDSFALPAFLVDIKLFYGPAWLMLSWIPVSVTGFEDVITTLLGLKFFNLALLIGTALLIASRQQDAKQRWLAATIFLANPLVLFEGLANAHNDVMMTFFLIAAVVALERRSPLAGALLVLAALVKFNPLVLAPLFLVVMLRDRWELRRLAATGALAIVAVVLVALPWWSDGEMVDGLTGGLEQSQRMDHVSVSSLARQWYQDREAQSVQGDAADFIRARLSFDVVPESTRDRLDRSFALAIAVIALLIARAVWRGAPVAPAAAATMLVLILLGTNFYPWYLIAVFAMIALRPSRGAMAYVGIATLAALAYFPMYVYAHFTTEWNRFQVHQFLALFLTLPAIGYAIVAIFRVIGDVSESDRPGSPGPISSDNGDGDSTRTALEESKRNGA